MMAPEQEVPYSQFRSELAAGEIGKVTIEPERILYGLKTAEGDEEAAQTRKVVRIEDEDLVEELVEAGVDFEAKPESKGLLGPLLGWVLPVLPFVLIFKETSTGASNDLERATLIARRMVTELGMSDKLGPVRYVGPAALGYLGSQATALSLSPETERMIDEEIRRILEDAQKEAMAIVADNESALHEIARVLQDKEVRMARPLAGSSPSTAEKARRNKERWCHPPGAMRGRASGTLGCL